MWGIDMKKIKSLISTIFISIFLMFAVNCTMNTYEITDISQYRTIPGTNYYGKYIAKYSNLVMPKEIEDFFIVEKYSLMYDVLDETHEEYLEIRIEDEAQYQEYIHEIIGDKETEEFFYDNTYQEYVVNDSIGLTYTNNETNLIIAKIQKIVFSDSMNKIVFLSLVIPGGYGPIDSGRFCYFKKFNINVATYYNGERISNKN
jgi:hypothetical protein